METVGDQQIDRRAVIDRPQSRPGRAGLHVIAEVY